MSVVSHQFSVRKQAIQNFRSFASQMRRAAASIPANIAEGCGRTSYADFARFLHIALGPASELDYFLILAHDLRFMEQADHDETLERIQEGKPMLSALIGHVRSELKTDN